MGQQVEGNLLTMQELQLNKLLILTKYKKYLATQLSKLADYTNKFEYPHIFDIGFECEGWFLDKNLNPAPVYDFINEKVGGTIGRELLSCQWEVRNEKDNLLKLSRPLSEINSRIKGVFSELIKVAKKEGLHLLLIGGFPWFTAEGANKMITDSVRHRKVIQYVDSYETNNFSIPFEDGNQERSGMIFEGFTTSVQITIRVSPIFASLYHDSYYLIAPILLAITAYSPFIEGKPTLSDSTRALIIGDAVYGFSEEDKEIGHPSRWGPLPPLSFPDAKPSKWANEDLYNLLRNSKVPNGVSLHFAEATGKGEGHLLVTDSDLEKDPEKEFPSPIMWPYVKFQPFRMNEDGILVELRYIENLRSPEEVSLFVPFMATMLEVVTHEMHLQKIFPLSLSSFCENEKICLSRDALLKNKAINWPHEGEVIKRPMKDIVRELVERMIPLFHKNGHTFEDIEKMCNPFISRVGIKVVGDKIEPCTPSETAAQELRRKGQESKNKGIELRRDMIGEYLF